MKRSQRTYILGMAKSPLRFAKGSYNGITDDFTKALNPGPSRSLELDFLRLVYASNELRAAGNDVIAYLMVATPEIQNMVENWRVKYEVDKDAVNIEHAS